MRVTALLFLVGCAASATSSSGEALTCDIGAPGALANACVKAASPLGTNSTEFQADFIGYGVHLTNGSATLTLPIAYSATYDFFLGTAGIALSVTDENGASAVPAGCTSSISSTECSSLRKVTSYDLVAGHTYTVALGPAPQYSYVRLVVNSRIEPPPVCAAGQLTEESAACTAADGTAITQKVWPVSKWSYVALDLDKVYLLDLAQGSDGTYSGAFQFVAPDDGIYELYLGTPNIPMRAVHEEGGPASEACTQYIPSTECSKLRRGTRIAMQASHSYRFELGPNASTRYVRVELRKEPPTASGVKLALAQTIRLDAAGGFPATADLDGDGNLDLAVSQANDAGGVSEVGVLQGSPAGTFTLRNQLPSSLPWQTAIADFNADGILDIVSRAWDGMGPLDGEYLTGQGNFQFGTGKWGNGRDYYIYVSAADFNEDGTKDLVSAWFDENMTTGGFTIVAFPSMTEIYNDSAFGGDTVQAIAGDFNGDGHQDVVAAGRSLSTLKLYYGNGTGPVTYSQDVALPGTGIWEIAAFDLDRDGKSDVVALHADSTATISYGTATGLSAPQVLQLGNFRNMGIATGDFDHDGRLDLVFSNADSGSHVLVYLARPGGFQLGGTLTVSPWSTEVAVGDFNKDGLDDLACGTGDGLAIFLGTP